MFIFLLPLLISLLLFVNYYIGYSKINNLVSFIYILNCLLLFDLLLQQIISKVSYILIIGEWFKLNNINVKWELIFNYFTVTLLFLIIFITTHIQNYSISYINNDINCSKFTSYISFFSFFMLIGVLSNNFIILLIGWEGVGILSYLLINYYDNRIEANKSGIKALLINKLGDMGLLLAIFSIYSYFISIKFNILNTLSLYLKYEILSLFIYKYELFILTIIALLLLLGISTKSAQFIFNTWLPDAMEGPTPVSALLHSATMVGIGFLLLLKLTLFMQSNIWFLFIIILIASFTSFLTSLGGFSCYDIKSINANSTSSQLSFMLLGYGNLNFSSSYYHFITHAIFKATLFLTSGLLIQQWGNKQDLRLITYIKRLNIPTITTGFIIAASSLIGLPSSLGSFSKEYIIEFNYSQSYSFNFNNWLLTLFAALLSTIYISLMFIIIINYKHQSSYKKNNIINLKGELLGMSLPIIGLLFLSLFLSSFINTGFINTNYLNKTFTFNSNQVLVFDYLFNYWFIKIIPITWMCFFFIAIWLINKISIINKTWVYNLFNINKFATGLLIDKLYNNFIIKSFWFFYFNIFRAINNKILNPYNFIHKFIKITYLFHKISNKKNLDYYLFLIIYFIFILYFIYF